jgi:mannose/fructose/N-acetylgalactosamine-specific phosphotransferase system component IIC
MLSLVWLGLIAGFLAVDQRAGWQGLLAQPVFAGGLSGLVVGELPTGICVGLFLELIYLSFVPMRGARLADQVAAGVVGAGTAGLLLRLEGGPAPELVCAVGIFLGLVAGEFGAIVTMPLYALHNRFLCNVEFAPDTDRRRLPRWLCVLHVSSVGFVFAVESLLVLGLGAVGYYMGLRAVRLVDGALARGTLFWGALITAIGVASVIHLFWQHRFRNVLLVCAVAVVIILWLW